MNIALDIDGTITSNPGFFSMLSHSVRRGGGKVYILTSRSDNDSTEKVTKEELTSYGAEFDELFIIADSGSQNQIDCLHQNLDW